MKVNSGDQPFHIKAVDPDLPRAGESEQTAETVGSAHRVAEPSSSEEVPPNVLDFASFARRMAAVVKSRQQKRKGKTRARQIVESYQAVASLAEANKPVSKVEKFHRSV